MANVCTGPRMVVQKPFFQAEKSGLNCGRVQGAPSQEANCYLSMWLRVKNGVTPKWVALVKGISWFHFDPSCRESPKEVLSDHPPSAHSKHMLHPTPGPDQRADGLGETPLFKKYSNKKIWSFPKDRGRGFFRFQCGIITFGGQHPVS